MKKLLVGTNGTSESLVTAALVANTAKKKESEVYAGYYVGHWKRPRRDLFGARTLYERVLWDSGVVRQRMYICEYAEDVSMMAHLLTVLGTGLDITTEAGRGNVTTLVLPFRISDSLSCAIASAFSAIGGELGIDIHLWMPLAGKDMKEVVTLGEELSVPWGIAQDCYHSSLPCGRCVGCLEVALAMAALGIRDPRYDDVGWGLILSKT